MRLRDLEATFLTYEPCLACVAHEKPSVHHRYVPTLAEAHGVMFLCPACYKKNAGPAGTHSIVCWFVGKVPDSAFPRPGRWIPKGTGLDDLTFVTGPGCSSPSVSLDTEEARKYPGVCRWHGHVSGGSAD